MALEIGDRLLLVSRGTDHQRDGHNQAGAQTVLASSATERAQRRNAPLSDCSVEAAVICVAFHTDGWLSAQQAPDLAIAKARTGTARAQRPTAEIEDNINQGRPAFG